MSAIDGFRKLLAVMWDVEVDDIIVEKRCLDSSTVLTRETETDNEKT